MMRPATRLTIAVTLPLLLSGSWPACVVTEDRDRPAVAAPGSPNKLESWPAASPDKLPSRRW